MSQFDSDFAAAAMPGLLGNFGQSVTYKPYGGTPRTITAIIRPMGPEGVISDSGGQVRIEVSTADDGTTGIAAASVRPGLDKVTVALRPGGSAEDFTIRIPNDGPWASAGMVRLWLE